MIVLSAAVIVGRPAVAAGRPNVLIIITDDQATSTLGAYGDASIDTPTLDRLASDGLTFDAARHMGSWTGAVCTASRRMIMTGRSVWRAPGARGVPKSAMAGLAATSLPAAFNDAGYDTFRTCKRGNSYANANAQFQTARDATKRGSTPDEGSAWHADRVLEWFDERQALGDADPWLVYLGFSHPHDTRDGPADLIAKYGAVAPGPPSAVNPAAPPLPANYLPQHPFPIGHPKLRDEHRVKGVQQRRDEATVRNELGKQAACIESIDTQIGRVLDRLRAAGELENTYVLFTSDHGIAVGSHGLMGKQNLYEHSWRVPLIVAGPGVPAGERTDAMVYLGELMPTVCELAGIDPPETVELPGFAQVALGRQDAVHDVHYGVYAGGAKPGIRAVTDGRWKLIEYDVLDGTVRETQLFDLRSNPDELLTGNLADSAEHRRHRARLERLLEQQAARWGDPFWGVD
ncbi:MAG: sulfatase-like hydrolase/transferase [Planctomycetota bacterium]